MIGFDYTERIDPAALKAAGCAVASRYLSNPGWPKNLTASEAAELHAAGVPILLNYETTADFMLGGYSAGVTCARSARQQAAALGAPGNARIFYSADFDASPSQTSIVVAFLNGAASVDGASNVGVYGGLRVVQSAAAVGYATWQTVAWSGGQWDSRALMRQTGTEQNVGGVQVDVNEIINLAGLGAWGGPTTGDDVALPAEDIAAIAKAVYEYGEEQVFNEGATKVPLGNLVHGAWDATNNPGSPLFVAVNAIRGQVNDLHMRPAPPTAAQIVTAVQTAVQNAVSAGLVTEQAGAQIAQQVVDHLTLTVGAK